MTQEHAAVRQAPVRTTNIENSFILTSGTDGVVRKWPSTLQATRAAVGHTGSITAVDVSANGPTIATASGDQTARLWQRSDGKPIRQL